MALYSQRDEGMYHMFLQLFPDSEIPITYMNWDGYIQKILDIRPMMSPMAQKISRPSVFGW